MELPLKLNPAIETERLVVAVENTSPGSVRIWSRRCSWGYSTFSLVVTPSPQPDDRRELTAKPVVWTRNFPRVVEIEPKGRALIDFAPGDPTWLGVDSLEPWKAETWEVRVRLRIPDTPQAHAHRVLIGESTSPPVIFQPPHIWLLG